MSKPSVPVQTWKCCCRKYKLQCIRAAKCWPSAITHAAASHWHRIGLSALPVSKVQRIDCSFQCLKAQLCTCACFRAVYGFCSICLECLQGPALIFTGIPMQNLVSQCPVGRPCHSSQQWHILSAQATVEVFLHRVRIHAASHWERMLCIHDLSACSAQ